MYNKLNSIMRGVYRLTCNDPNLVYYGSSINIYERETKHKSHHKKWKEGNGNYCSSSKLYEVGGVEVELVLECSSDISKREMKEIEQTYINNDECVNLQRAFRTDEEEKQYNKEYQKAYSHTDNKREKQRDYDLTRRIFKEFL